MNKHVCGELNLIGQTTDVDCLKLEGLVTFVLLLRKIKLNKEISKATTGATLVGENILSIRQ